MLENYQNKPNNPSNKEEKQKNHQRNWIKIKVIKTLRSWPC